MSMEQLYVTVRAAQHGDFDHVLRRLTFRAEILARIALMRRGIDWRTRETSAS